MVKIKEINKWQPYSYESKKEEVEEYIEGPGFLSNELRYIDWDQYPKSPFPDSFQPTKLVVLKLSSMQKELWRGYKANYFHSSPSHMYRGLQQAKD